MDANDRWAAKQAILPMPFEDVSLRDDDFIVSLCNQQAYEATRSQKIWPNNRLLILGEAGSGKSHLAKMWVDRVGAQAFNEPFEKLYQGTHSAILAEDIDALAGEEELFHLINYCTQERITLLMTARTMPTPKLQDLKSRLNATYKILIKAPDDELVKILLYKYFATNQITVDPEVFDYLSLRIDRSFEAIAHVAELLNTMSLEQKRAITIPFVRCALEIDSASPAPLFP